MSTNTIIMAALVVVVAFGAIAVAIFMNQEEDGEEWHS